MGFSFTLADETDIPPEVGHTIPERGVAGLLLKAEDLELLQEPTKMNALAHRIGRTTN